MARAVTVRDIAQSAEVSIATVSRVLSNKGNINETLRQRVLQTATELGYFKQARHGAQRSASKTLRDIGFLLMYGDQGDLSSFWAPVLNGAQNAASTANLKVTYATFSLHDPPYLLINKIHDLRLDGILLAGPIQPEHVRTVQSMDLPLVLIDSYVRIPERPVDAVVSDNFEGMRDAVTFLINQGHQRIVFIGGYDTLNPTYSLSQRKAGYLQALHDAHLPIHENLIYEIDIAIYEQQVAACQHLLASGNAFSAICCANDPTAGNIMKLLVEAGKRISEDISIVGFDDITLATHLSPALTTVRVHKEAMGATALQRLIARDADPTGIRSTSIMAGELIQRASVSPYHDPPCHPIMTEIDSSPPELA